MVFNTVDVIALSLHPKSEVKKMGLTNACKLALAEVEKFQELFLLENSTHIDDWVEKATSDTLSESYPAQMCLMSWFLSLVSKMEGVRIPSINELQVGGRIMKEWSALEWYIYFDIIEAIIDEMSEK